MSLTETDRATGVREAVRTLHPGYFALVMATGIVSIGMHNHGMYALSVVLLWLGFLFFAVLVVLTTARIVLFRADFAADLRDPRRAFGSFTFVAAADVLGTRLAVDTHYRIALALLLVGSLAWLVLGYVVPWAAVLRTTHRPVLQHANGTWFIWVVASESVAVLAAALEPELETGRRELALLAVLCWSVGVFLYGAAGIFVGARMLLYGLKPEDLTPPLWVSMGATAITVVAGARIVEMAHAPMVDATSGLIAGMSVVFWAFGTWLIPPLIGAGIWKHVVHRIPLRYEAPLWSVVFPLGMYGVGGDYLGKADRLPIVEYIGADESWIALAAWVITFVAMLHHVVTTLRRPEAQSSSCPDSSVSTAPAAADPSSASRRR
ncbi:tellurite resistance protein permease [Mycobacterium sp. MFM001]|uniref:tellurite resistance/C4-dicarboxylate transporter family protein n=1 Tax=Mycobacterium sp. MFM001 TaxID=2049453 RepID=UPI000DA5C1C2|nr:tellurite resistance/C4-dicarboxylate transporter family protein [Mycobacterium sp. MFM001]GBE65505.1 tellurite resistance protein permease [Mycobacterium sp. MFM001]